MLHQKLMDEIAPLKAEPWSDREWISQELLQYGHTGFWKIWKRCFFQDIQNSFW